MKEDSSNKGCSPPPSLPMPGAWKGQPFSLPVCSAPRKAGQPVNQGGILPNGSIESPEQLPFPGTLSASPALAHLGRAWAHSQGCNESWQLFRAPTWSGVDAEPGNFVSGCWHPPGSWLWTRPSALQKGLRAQRAPSVWGAVTKPSVAINTHWSPTASSPESAPWKTFLFCLECMT